MRLTGKYTLFISLAMVITIALVLALIAIFTSRQVAFFRDDLGKLFVSARIIDNEQALKRNASYLGQRLYKPLRAFDISGLNEEIKQVRRWLPVNRFIIADSSGRIVTDGSIENPKYGEILQVPKDLDRQKRLVLHYGADLELNFVIGYGELVLGYALVSLRDIALTTTIETIDANFSDVWREVAQAVWLLFFLALVLTVSIGAVFSLWLSHFLSKPLTEMSAAAETFARGELDYRLPVRSRDELGELAASLNKMASDLNEGEERFHQIADNINAVLWMINPTVHKIIFVNRAYEKIWGRTRESLYHDSRGWQAAIHREDKARVSSSFEKMLQGTRFDEEYRILRPDGSMRWVRDYGFPIKGSDGDIYRIVGFAEDTTDRKNAAKQIIASLEEKEVLLQEIHHRVKNNMQVVSGLLDLQVRNMEGKIAPSVLMAFRESESRIKSIALVHERLYRSKDFAHVDFQAYVRQLAADLFRSYEIDQASVELTVQTEDVQVDINQGVPCGLIVNELLSNALQHAFPNGRKGHILVALRLLREEMLELKVCDDGAGLPDEIDIENSSTLGLTLVTALARQLDGEVQVERTLGTCIQVRFQGE